MQRLEENSWYHYAVVIGPDGNTAYINGEELTDRIYNFGDPSLTDFFNDVQIQDMLTMGYGWSTAARGFSYFNGWLDDVRIYNRPLSAAEIGILAGDDDGVPPPPVGSVTYQTEDGAISGNAFIGTRSSGFTGDGYVHYQKAGATVEHAVVVPAAGTYELTFRYGLDSGQVAGQVAVDSRIVDPDLVFTATGSWTNWQTVTTTVELDGGTHPVALSVSGLAINVDRLVVTPR